MELRTFDEAIEHSARFKKRHLLLGNGFSIACRQDIFTYGSLFEQADFSSTPRLPGVFQKLATTDFEHVIKALEDASRIAPLYSTLRDSTSGASQMAEDAKALKNILIETVGDNHPKIPNEIADEQFSACRKFLAYFLGDQNKDGKVYTLSYDLLLYWTLMHEDAEPNYSNRLAANDGFGRDEDTEAEYVNWMGETGAREQRVHYLHGALHLFDSGPELQKYTWVNTGKPLLEQAREAMEADKYPLFVAEGKSDQKLARIKHSAYLHHSYKSFSAQMAQRSDVLFIFGHSLADNDLHVLKKIARGKIGHLYVGLYGDVNSKENRQIRRAAKRLCQTRQQNYWLEVDFFDAASARVWGN